jgi:histidinol-phosphatase (PHP family)
MPLTGDGHVHSEWSFDTGGPRSAAAGRMEAMCRHALKIGLPALAFTEHLPDPPRWRQRSTPEAAQPACRPPRKS